MINIHEAWRTGTLEQYRAVCDKLIPYFWYDTPYGEIQVYNKEAIQRHRRVHDSLIKGIQGGQLRFLHDGDRIVVLASRVSKASQTTSCNMFVNKTHGYVLVECAIRVQSTGTRRFKFSKEDIQKYTCPIGQESTKQHLLDHSGVPLALIKKAD